MAGPLCLWDSLTRLQYPRPAPSLRRSSLPGVSWDKRRSTAKVSSSSFMAGDRPGRSCRPDAMSKPVMGVHVTHMCSQHPREQPSTLGPLCGATHPQQTSIPLSFRPAEQGQPSSKVLQYSPSTQLCTSGAQGPQGCVRDCHRRGHLLGILVTHA